MYSLTDGAQPSSSEGADDGLFGAYSMEQTDVGRQMPQK